MTVSQPAATFRWWLAAGAFGLANFWLVAVLSMGAWVVLPIAVGWMPLVIGSDSMTPALSTGDIIVIDDYDGRPLEVGTVVSYRDAGRLTTHRIVDAHDDGDGYVTQGDANPAVDSTTLTPDAIEGSGRIVVPLLARPYTELAAGQPGPALGWGAVTVVALATVSLRPGVRAKGTSMGVHHCGRNDNIGRRGDGPTGGRGRLAGETDRPHPTPVGVPGSLSPDASVDALHQPREHPLAAATAGPTGTGVIWHASNPLTSTPTSPADRTTRPLVSLLRTLGAVVVGALLLTAGVSGAPFMDTTASPGSWQAELHSPTNVSADPGCSSSAPYVDISWTANASADGYHIDRKVNDGTWSTTHTVTDSALEAWRDHDVIDGNDYHYRLQAFLGSGSTSAFSNVASATVGGSLICL